jgi:hypothetical protein
MPTLLLVILVAVWVIAFAIAGYEILWIVDREIEGIVYAVLFGPVGLVIAWAVRSNVLLQREEMLRKQSPR